MVQTPWFEEEIPFNMAAEIGTRKVITEHSTIGLVVTTDGSITEIPRDEYEEAEEYDKEFYDRLLSDIEYTKNQQELFTKAVSYINKKGWVVGLEPTTSRTTIWRANQLHHTHHINEPGGIRTLDLRLRRPLLYPAELRTHLRFSS